MGRKKKKVDKPWCWYCNREFEDEKILIQHQKAKHFKCHICNKKLYTGPGLAIHCMQVHKETIDKIPQAIPGRDSIDVEVYGMEGIPQAFDAEEPKAKKPAPAIPPVAMPMGIPMPGFPPGNIPMPSMPGFPPNIPMPSFSAASSGFLQMPQMPRLPAQYQMNAGVGSFFGAMQRPQIPVARHIPMPGSHLPSMPSAPSHMLSSVQCPSSAQFTAQPSTSASVSNPTTVPATRTLGSKTRIVVPDENISLEEAMANRLELLSQARY